MTDPSDSDLDKMRARILGETAQIGWNELLRQFAAGNTLFVAPGLDLVEVALQMQLDNTDQVAAWLKAEQLCPVRDDQAQQWHRQEESVWACVVKPWVLVQPGRRT